MIKKQKTDYQTVEGMGRPFEMNPRYPIEKNDAERQRPVIIHLGELNGQSTDRGMPKNFHKKAGRTLVSFTDYWSPSEVLEKEEEFDIE